MRGTRFEFIDTGGMWAANSSYMMMNSGDASDDLHGIGD